MRSWGTAKPCETATIAEKPQQLHTDELHRLDKMNEGKDWFCPGCLRKTKDVPTIRWYAGPTARNCNRHVLGDPKAKNPHPCNNCKSGETAVHRDDLQKFINQGYTLLKKAAGKK